MSDDDPEWLSPQGGPLMLPAPVPEPPPFTRQTQEPLSEPTAQSPRAHSSESNTSSMIVIQAEGSRFSFPRHILEQSDFFRDMLNSTHLGCESEGTESNPIVLDTISQVTKFQVESFYRVIDHRAAKS
ncbi:hypothetical protein FRC05_001898 [Tulasnella sp. 425]|nr:hypothetical protein FRC05_001898 [Tulasnella sp. 425]